ncbi:DNA replication endonuclease-helicase Dna2, partial [Kickxella alabastrina]
MPKDSPQRANLSQKRRYEATTPQRHHSADSPLSVRKIPRPDQGMGNSSDDVILWQAMSPSGTLKRVLRQRIYPGQKDVLVDDTTLTRGIVQQIIESRNTENLQTADKPDDASDRSRIVGRLPPPRFNLCREESKDSFGGESENMMLNDFDADLLLDKTPLAQQRTLRPVPRPLTLSRSEKGFDKRQLLSSLLLLPRPDTTAVKPTPYVIPAPIVPIKIEYSADNAKTQVSEATQSTSVAITATATLVSGEGDVGDSQINNTADFLSMPTEDTKVESQLDDNVDFDLQLADIDMDILLEDLDSMEDLEDMGALEGIDDLLLETESTPLSRPVTDSVDHMFRNFEKCLTLLVTDGLYTRSQLDVPTGTFGALPQKIVRVYSQTARRERSVYLRDDWYSTPILIGDYLNLVGTIPETTGKSVVVIDSQTGNLLLVLHPDILVSCTHLADSFFCIRRAVLKDRIREISDGSPPNTVMLIGTLLHDLFQSCTLKNKWDTATMTGTISSLIADNIEHLWACQIDEESVHKQITEVVPIYQDWAKRYMHRWAANGSYYATPSTGNPRPDPNTGSASVALSKILDIEENVWSPKFGLKGKVDLTVLAQYSAAGAMVEPFELKTGRITQNTSHRAQLVLYTLMLSDRYNVDINSGLLYYPRTGEMIQVPRVAAELRGLMTTRNQMTQYLKHNKQMARLLPEMAGDDFKCSRCSYRPSCFIMHCALEGGSDLTAQVSADSWMGQVDHLSERHLEFMRTWMALIDGEESDMMRFRAELWNMRSDHRELRTGRCLSNMRIEVDTVEDTRAMGSYNRYKTTFVPAPGSTRRSMLDSQISAGDPISVSSETGQYALSVGYVYALEYNRIILALDRPVRGVPKRMPGFCQKNNQDFESIVEIRQRGPSVQNEETVIHPEVPQSASKDTFRIDKDEMSTGMSRIRANVMRLFVAQGGDSRWRRLIVDLQAPTFRPLHENIEARVLEVQRLKRLNTGQAAVLRKVLAANDYALVMGMPGTGKTTTIAELVNVLVDSGKSVLLASYTHVAVDNIMLKLQDRGIQMVRLGNRNKVHPRVVQHLSSEAQLKTVRQIDDFFRLAPVVATTCLGVNHPIFTMRKFDYCIIDEASQITLPVCLGPLLESTRFVLVGDHHQLPPLVRNASARDAGLGTSLFKRLCEAHPSAVVRLEYQYRMNSDIQRLANNLIYDGHLRCGSHQVATQKISYKMDPATAIETWPFAVERPIGDINMAWAVAALDPSKGAVFIDTDCVPGTESRAEGADIAQNDVEIKIIKVLTSILLACGVEGRDVGLLSPYRTQLKQLEIEYGVRSAEPDDIASDHASASAATHVIGGAVLPNHSGIEMHTIDRYQGRDANIIIIS